MFMWLGILGVVTFITVIFTSRKWWLLTIIATMVGLYILVWFSMMENPWTCHPETTFPINPQSRILCAPEVAGLIGHWRFSPSDFNKELRTPKFFTLSEQQSITYASIYNRSVKLYKACIIGIGYRRSERELEGVNYSSNVCSINYFNRTSYTGDDITDLVQELVYEEREFYRQFPVLGDKRPWMD